MDLFPPPPPPKDPFWKILIDARERSKFTQYDVGVKTCGPELYARAEGGQVVLGKKHLRKIARLLTIRYDELVEAAEIAKAAKKKATLEKEKKTDGA